MYTKEKSLYNLKEVLIMDLLEVMRSRRSVRTYTGETVAEEKVDQILKAGLLSASGKNLKPWEFIVVRDKEVLAKLTKSRAAGAAMIEHADCAIVVIGDTEKTDVWTEDCSAAMTNMHLMADYLGVGSCWVQGRLREASDGRTTEDFIRELLSILDKYGVEAILSLGMTKDHPAAYSVDELPMEKVHKEKF